MFELIIAVTAYFTLIGVSVIGIVSRQNLLIHLCVFSMFFIHLLRIMDIYVDKFPILFIKTAIPYVITGIVWTTIKHARSIPDLHDFEVSRIRAGIFSTTCWPIDVTTWIYRTFIR